MTRLFAGIRNLTAAESVEARRRRTERSEVKASMTYLVRFHTEAEAEMNEAADYLNRESTGLGEVFLDNLRHAIDLVASHPEIAPIVKGRVRRKPLRKFPYSLISVVGEEIRILAIMHQHRRPFCWRHRN